MGTVLSASAQQPPARAPAQPAQIDRNGVLILIRTTLIALHQANETGNYTVLRDLGAPAFQQGNTAARLSELFASQRTRKLDLSGVAALDPQLTLLPQIEANGMLHMAGFFPSIPTQINFELLYAPVDGHWRPFGISVGVSSATPAAPAPAPTPPAASVSKPQPTLKLSAHRTEKSKRPYRAPSTPPAGPPREDTAPQQ